jgi:ribosomal protein S18 acetylase RimI-like enzyme
MSNLINPYIKLKENINLRDYTDISNLQKSCIEHDQITLKLELDYKLLRAKGRLGRLQDMNEFMYYDDDLLVGYLGIGDFGGDLELNGMVHPQYRRKGIFKMLFSLVKKEWRRRATDGLLLLSDHHSIAGLEFIKSIPGAKQAHSEYEMILKNKPCQELNTFEVILKKATNRDAQAIERLSSICFEEEYDEEKMLKPDEEEKCGMRIYLAEVNDIVVGKIHLEVSSGVAGIYGFGVLPEYRRKGYGRAILIKAIDTLRKDHFKDIKIQVEVKNEKALNLYRSCGFEVASIMDYYELRKVHDPIKRWSRG